MSNMQMERIKENYVTVKEMLEKQKKEIAAALPKHISADTMLQVVMTSIRMNPKLMECEPKSFVTAVLIASQFGLLPDGVTGQSYIIPFKNNKKGGIVEAQLQLGYKGELELARRSNQIGRVECQVVYEKDTFEYEFGLNPVLRFKPSNDKERGAKKYIYALVQLKDGSPYFDVWTIEQINKHRYQYSKMPDGPAWTGSPDKMGKKTVLKQVLDYCPMSVEYQKASKLDDLAEAGLPQDLDILIDPDSIIEIEAEPEPKSKLDQIVENEAAKKGEPAAMVTPMEGSLIASSPENYSSLVDTLDAATEFLTKVQIASIVQTMTGPNRTKDQLKDDEVVLLIKQVTQRVEKARKA